VRAFVVDSPLRMKAILYEQCGGPEVLRMADIAAPELRKGDLLVRVKIRENNATIPAMIKRPQPELRLREYVRLYMVTPVFQILY
jgi:hypothetical protein